MSDHEDEDPQANEARARRPEDWTPEEKLGAVLEANGLDDQELGAFLRRRGLHREHLEQWRAQATEAFSTKPKRRGRSAEQKRIRKLERELVRKEKALAEAAALLVLKRNWRRSTGRTRTTTPAGRTTDDPRGDRRSTGGRGTTRTVL